MPNASVRGESLSGQTAWIQFLILDIAGGLLSEATSHLANSRPLECESMTQQS